jgi:hypothetical protein
MKISIPIMKDAIGFSPKYDPMNGIIDGQNRIIKAFAGSIIKK